MHIPRVTGAAALAVLLLGACSSGSGGSAPSPSPRPSTATTSAALPRPAGPAATFSGPLTAGKGISLLSTADLTSTPALRVAEYVASGTATAYAGSAPPDDGRWTLTPAGSAPYRTRVIVRTPTDPARFNGTVLVEWLNVSAGADSAPDYTYARDELLRAGYAYVGVTAQQVGIDGSRPGDIASQLVPGLAVPGLRKADPARYGSLRHPGDAYSYDMFTQIARALRGPGAAAVLGGLHPQRLIAAGESQSAARMTTYVDGVQPLTRAFDGFLIHSRGGGAAPLSGSGDGASVVDGAVRIRTDLLAPVLLFETETDISVLRYDRAEQPDTSRIRLWEVAGTSHADAYVVGPAAGLLGCGAAINNGPQHIVLKAGLAALDRWVRTGDPPPSAPRFVHTGARLARDGQGIVRGGIRTPVVDVPVAVESGEPAAGSKPICALFGSSRPLPAAQLKQMYGDRSRYLQAYDRSARSAVARGFVLSADLAQLERPAREVTFPA